MAIVVVAGGALGFAGAVGGYVALDLGLLACLGIWAGSGPVAAAVGLGLALRRPRVPEAAEEPRPALAPVA